jgi:HAMP domain-containing protein
VLFFGILLVAVVPLAWRYYHDCRNDALQHLATTLEVFAERGTAWVDVASVAALTHPKQQTPAYQALVHTLQRMEREFHLETAAILRRAADGSYTYVATGNGSVAIGQPVALHTRFPATYTATNAAWMQGTMRHSPLFGGGEGGPFMQIDMPLKHQDTVVAILTLTASTKPVAAAAHAKALTVVGLTSGLLVVGLTLFGAISAGLLHPLQDLTTAADRVAQGELTVMVPPPRTRDEVGQLTRAFHTMLVGLRQRDFIRDTFGRYLSKNVVAALLGSPEGLKLGGEVQEITFLVSDLRGFSSLAAHLSPQAVIAILNRYFERMIDIICSDLITSAALLDYIPDFDSN